MIDIASVFNKALKDGNTRKRRCFREIEQIKEKRELERKTKNVWDEK